MKMVLDKGGKGYVTSDTSIYCFSYDIIIDKGHRTQAIELELDFGKKDSLKSLPTGVLIRNHLLLMDANVPTIHFKKTRVQRVHGSLIRETRQ